MMSRWRSGTGGEVAIPHSGNALPCPVAVAPNGPLSPQYDGTLANLTDIRLYVAGAHNLTFGEDFLGVLAPHGKPGDRVPVRAIQPWKLYVLPANWQSQSPAHGDYELREAYALGYEAWKAKHEQWARQQIWNEEGEFSVKKIKKPKIVKIRRRLRKIEPE